MRLTGGETAALAARLVAHDRWLGGPSAGAILGRAVMGRGGVFFTDGPLLNLPEKLGLESSIRVLEVGRRRGTLLRMLDERVRFDQEPVGVDLSAALLRLGARGGGEAGQPSATARAAPWALPFRDGTFDLVLSGYVAGRLSDGVLPVFLAEVHRVLSEGGLALLWDFAPTGSARLDGWNRRVLGWARHAPRLRSTATLLAAAQAAGFDFARDAVLRPFLLPPVPRASVLLGRSPGGLLP